MDARLSTLEALWRREGLPATAHLRPGVDRDETATRLAELGLVAPTELLDWFSWHDGVTDARAVTPCVYLRTLDECVEDFTSRVRYLGENDPTFLGYFPILQSSDGGAIVMDCSGRHPDRSPVHYMMRELIAVQPGAPSLATLVDWWLLLWESGVWRAPESADGWPALTVAAEVVAARYPEGHASQVLF